MSKHELKTDPAVFQAVADGAKTYEIRFNDRGFAVGDELLLRETTCTGAEIAAGAALEYTGRELTRTVSHVLTGYGLVDGWAILSFAHRATEAVDEAAAQADAWITPQVAQNLDRQYRDGFMAGWNAQLDGDEELLAAVQSRVKPLAEYAAAPAAQPTPPDDELRQAVQRLLRSVDANAALPSVGFAPGCQLFDDLRAALRHPPVPNGGEPTIMGYVATDLDGHAGIGFTIEEAKKRAPAGCYHTFPVYDLGAQPTQAGAEPAKYSPSWTETIDEDGQREEPGMRKSEHGKYYRASDVDPIIADLRARLASAGAGVDTALLDAIAGCKMYDRFKGRTNEGRWVTINVPREVGDNLRARAAAKEKT